MKFISLILLIGATIHLYGKWKKTKYSGYFGLACLSILAACLGVYQDFLAPHLRQSFNFVNDYNKIVHYLWPVLFIITLALALKLLWDDKHGKFK